MRRPLEEGCNRISTRSSVEDLCRIMQRPLREELSRISKRTQYSRIGNENSPDQELVNLAAQTLRGSQEPLYARILRENAAGQDQDAPLNWPGRFTPWKKCENKLIS